MKDNDYYKKEKTFRVAWIISLIGSSITVYAYIVSGSATIFADLFRRSTELLSMFISWLIFVKINKKSNIKPVYFTSKLENVSGLLISFVMFFSFILISINTIEEFMSPKPVGWIIPGLLLAVFGVIINSYFWRRHTKFSKEESSPIIEAQRRLYRSKTMVDASVVITLITSKIFESYHWHLYIDPIGSVIVAAFILFSAIKVFSESIGVFFD
ncbi:cation diffusion facilitator family transporter [Natranaerofaba carboxydovora]|uniref:cation diffusion facilitator family transporter n=1 Tax=Natranaerofaba carboxydovora TaxID=2742683 RepID=UPI001F12E43C|nr:cation transporter [Natranaerofaba carboxydovora]UMZ73809.1 Cation efflux family protein [Natranaerofaba carboxydovora]